MILGQATIAALQTPDPSDVRERGNRFNPKHMKRTPVFLAV